MRLLLGRDGQVHLEHCGKVGAEVGLHNEDAEIRFILDNGFKGGCLLLWDIKGELGQGQ